MILLSCFFIIVGSFCFYNTSKKVSLNNSSFEKWLQTNSITSKILGSLLYVLSFILELQNFDVIIGAIYWVLLVGIILCFLIIFMPLINQKK